MAGPPSAAYPQKYGKPDPNARGMTGPENDKGETTWGGLAEEIRSWANWVLEKVRKEIGDLYHPIPDPAYKGKRSEIEFDRDTGLWVPKGSMGKRTGPQEPGEQQTMAFADKQALPLPDGYLTPVAYLWTRTVKCKNPSCGATIPLVKQTWLAGRRDALLHSASRLQGTAHVRSSKWLRHPAKLKSASFPLDS